MQAMYLVCLSAESMALDVYDVMVGHQSVKTVDVNPL